MICIDMYIRRPRPTQGGARQGRRVLLRLFATATQASEEKQHLQSLFGSIWGVGFWKCKSLELENFCLLSNIIAIPIWCTDLAQARHD